MNGVLLKIILLVQAMEAGFFYIFAVLVGPALFHPAPARKKYLRSALIAALLFFVGWRSVFLWNNPVGRYFVFPALFGCVLLPCGIDWVAAVLRRFPPLSQLGARTLAVVLTVVCVAVIGIKVGRAGGKVRDFIPALAELVPPGATIYGDASDTRRIAALAGADSVKDDDLEQLIFRLSADHETSDGQYLLTAVPRGLSPAEFADRFRWFFGVFPFDFVGSGVYRSEAYYLWKYNRKAGDGEPDGVPAALPELKPTGKFPEFLLLGPDVPDGWTAELRSPQFSYFFGNELHFTRPPEVLPVDWQCRLIVRNRRLWPVAVVSFRLSADRDGAALPESGTAEYSMPRLLPAVDDFPAAPAPRIPSIGLKKTPEKTVIFEDPHTADFQLAQHLSLPDAAVVTLDFGAMGDFADKTPERWIAEVAERLDADNRVGLVIFNLGLHEIYSRHAELAFNPEKWRAGMSGLVAAAKEKYPEAAFLLVVPPAPAPGKCRIMPNGNAARAVLAYRRYADLAVTLYPDNTLIFDPGTAPGVRRMFAPEIAVNSAQPRYEAPFALTERGRAEFAAAVMEALK